MRPLLLIHIPKTAGTAIINSSAFQNRWRGAAWGDANNEIELDFNPDENLSFGHVDINEVKKRNIITDEQWNNYYKFCFVRNPWDRAVSLYEYRKTCPWDSRPDMSFGSFIFNLHNVKKIGFYNEKGLSQCRPQADWIPKDIDYIGKLETIHSDVERIRQISRGYINPPKKENITRSRKNKHYREYFPNDSVGKYLREEVEEVYKEDIERFNYTF